MFLLKFRPASGGSRAVCGAGLLGLGLSVSGCAGLSGSSGSAFDPLRETVQARAGAEPVWPRSAAQVQAASERQAALLARPLDADAAVQVALLGNRGLQARYAELGLAEATRLRATSLPNPGFSFARLRRGDEVETERGWHLDLARLLTLPLVAGVEARRVEQARLEASLQTLALAADVRRAWVEAVAAEEALAHHRRVQQVAQAGAELARRMQAAGNWSRLSQAREEAARIDAELRLAQAQEAALAARERLTRLLGLERPDAYTLPLHLPALPERVDELPDLEQRALDRRLDLLALQSQAQAQAANLGLSRATGFINVLELGGVNNGSNEEPVQRGYEISLELPLFDWGQARHAQAEALYMQSVHRLAQAAVDARSEVRLAAQRLRSRHALAHRYQAELLPLARQVSKETLLRYNGMLLGVFDLLADARAQAATVNAAVQARRDYWLAQADLQAALDGPLGAGSAGLGAPSSAAAAAPSAGPAHGAAH